MFRRKIDACKNKNKELIIYDTLGMSRLKEKNLLIFEEKKIRFYLNNFEIWSRDFVKYL